MTNDMTPRGADDRVAGTTPHMGGESGQDATVPLSRSDMPTQPLKSGGSTVKTVPLPQVSPQSTAPHAATAPPVVGPPPAPGPMASASDQPPAPRLRQTIFVAPDGSRIAVGPGVPSYSPMSAEFSAMPPTPTAPVAPVPPPPRFQDGETAANTMPPMPPMPMPAPPASQPRIPAAALAVLPPQASQIRVGLLVWGVILAIVGLALVLVPAFGGASFQGLMVILFALAGIAFLVLAYRLSKKPDSLSPHDVP